MSLPFHTHTFIFNPDSNGGEQIALTTNFYKDRESTYVYSSQTLTMNSYANSISINAYGMFDVDTLERLVSELKAEMDKATVIACLTTP